MITVWKYPISVSDVLVVVPADAELLAVKVQNEKLVLYAVVDTEKAAVSRVLYGIRTGFHMPVDAKKYLGTTQLPMPDGVFVQHWYSTH
jgi:hypothetical protein